LSFDPGTRLGHYEIIERIGAGGMGEVYKARDPRLKRTVAIKVLLQAVSDAPDARSRFEREAQTLAGLNHPHICVVYDVGRHENSDFLVMEFLEGQTLARRLEREPLPLDEALKCAVEIADALDRAHRSGVTHRDIKPGNIMLTRSGVKLLDFGLAKLRSTGNVSTFSQAATNADLTAQGTIVGSLQYMAPEQLEGSEADSRTDIFAFGAVLHETITGRKAFEGKTAVSLMSAILKDAPKPVTSWQAFAPEALDRAVATCLAKDPDDRWQSARDLGRELKRVAETISQSGKGGSSRSEVAEPQALTARRAVPAAVAAAIAVIAILITAIAVWTFKPSASTAPFNIARLSVTLEPGEELRGINGPPVALSPNGAVLAYASTRRGALPLLYLRTIDNTEARAVTGSDGASLPFFSANGQWVGFFAQSKLKKVSVSGGVVETLCDVGNGRGGSWAEDDTIYFAPANTSGIWKVSAAGGMPVAVTTLNRAKGEVSHRWPQVLPGGKALLLTVWTGPGWDENQLQVLNLATGERSLLVQGARMGLYASSGHVVYFRQGPDTLLAAPFDLSRLQITGGPPVTLVEHVRDTSESGEYAVSASGVLAYIPTTPHWNESRLVWVDRQGNVEPLPAPPQRYQEPAISPDGRQMAISIAGPAYTIAVYDFERSALTRLPSPDGSSQSPTWTADGKRIVYRATRMGSRNLFQRMADASRGEERLSASDNLQTPGSFSADGKEFVFTVSDPVTGMDIWTLGTDQKATPILSTVGSQTDPQLSPDGRWLVYVSDESGRNEIYVQPFPKMDGKWKISIDGGLEPRWARNGRELFYRNGARMLSVSVEPGSTFIAAVPKLLFEGAFEFSGTSITAYDVALDGRRFLMVQSADDAKPATEIRIVFNWFEELKSAVFSRKQ
jgi:serine/threonine-protein kinase